MRRIIIGILALSLVLNTAFVSGVYAESADNGAVDEIYVKAAETLEGLGLVKNSDKQPNDKVTRAEFADIVVKVLNWNSMNGETETETKKFLGFTNDPVFDDVEGWIWNGDGSSEEITEAPESENATPFRDVLSTNKYWESIRIIARLGLMVGDSNRYFRPNDSITLKEAEKVLLYACGRAVLIGSDFESGIISEASKTGLVSGLKVKGADERVSYRDAIVLLYNALDVNVLKASSYTESGAEYSESDDETFLSYFTDIYKSRGTVTKNSITSIDEPVGTNDDTVYIENERYKTNNKNYDAFLGTDVDFYYSAVDRNDDINTILYLRDGGRTKETVIKAKDVSGYVNNRLTYYTASGKENSEYLGSGIYIIYNGKALREYTDYGDEIITPRRGSIRFVDTTGDGKYDIVFIDDIKTVMVSAVDSENEYIYNKLDKDQNVDLNNREYRICDKDGNALTLGDISINSVIDVRSTLETQGELWTYITLNNSVVTGTVTKHNPTKSELTVDGKTYKYAEEFDTALIDTGVIMTFYLNSDEEVVWASKGTELTFVFLVNIGFSDSLSDEVKIKVYDLAEDNFKVYELASKVVINKHAAVKGKEIKESVLWNKAQGHAASQLIKIKLNAEGKVTELMSEKNADGTLVDENEMVEVPFTPCEGGLIVRTGVGMLSDMYAAVAYFNSDTAYSIVPLTDFDNLTAYYKGKNFAEGVKIESNKMYKAKKSSAVAAVILLQEDTGGLSLEEKQNIRDGAPSLVSEIERTISEEDDICYQISGVDMNKSSTFTYKVVDSDLMNVVDELEPGDLIQYETGGQYNYVQRLKKVFDVGDMTWTANYGGGTKNPVNRRADYFDEGSQTIHGRVSTRPDDGAYIRIAPYIYDAGGNTGVIDEESKFACTYPTKYFKYFVFDRENEIMCTADVYTDLIGEDEGGVGKGSEVIAWTCYGQAKTVIIYK